MFKTNWNVEKYREESEYEKHWILRREFIITHKGKYSEEKLVGLSKTMQNIEILGCVYNRDLMLLIKNLSDQVKAIVEHREEKKSKLKRTFVKASDAVKRHSTSNNEYMNNSAKRKVKFVAANNETETDCLGMKANFKMDDKFQSELLQHVQKIQEQKGKSPMINKKEFIQIGQRYFPPEQLKPQQLMQPQRQLMQPQRQQQMQPPKFLSRTQQKKQNFQNRKQFLNEKYKLKFNFKPDDEVLLNKAKHQNGILSKFIIYEIPNKLKPFACLDVSVKKLNINMQIKKNDAQNSYTLYMNEETICEYSDSNVASTTPTKKGHRKTKIPALVQNELSAEALKHFKKYCFTVIDHKTKDYEEISANYVDNLSKSKVQPDLPLSMDSVGAKMMKQMGWTGQGLGKHANGIIEPIQAEIKVHRRGFGHTDNQKAFEQDIRTYFKNYLESGETKRLVFATDFSKADRALLHQIAGTFCLLRSKSYGKDENRYLTIERKLSGWELVEQLLANNDSNDCYTLIRPTDL